MSTPLEPAQTASEVERQDGAATDQQDGAATDKKSVTSRRRLGRFFGRASLNLADQGLSALTNVALAFLVARAVSASAFGAFSVAFLVFILLIGLERAMVGEPMSIRYSNAEGEERRRAVGAAMATVLVTTLVGGLLVASGGLIVGGPLGTTLLVLAPALPGLILQDACRMTFFAQRRPHLALLNDATWTVVQFAAMGFLYVKGVDQPWPYVLAWGVSATVAALLGLVQLRAWPLFGEVVWWMRAQLDLTGYLMLEYLMGAASAQGSILLVGAVGSLHDVGSFRAAQTLLGPLGIVATAVMTFLLPEVSRRTNMLSETRVRIAAGVSAVVAVGAVLYTGGLLLIPDSLGTSLLGDTWTGASDVLLPMAVASAAGSVTLGPAIIIYAMGQARKTFRLHAIEAPLIIICMATGLALAGARGAAWGMAINMTLMIPLWFWQLNALKGTLAKQPVPND